MSRNSRNSDPESSHDAEDSAPINALLEIALTLVDMWPGRTPREYGALFEREFPEFPTTEKDGHDAIRRRLSQGKVEHNLITGPSRRCTISSRKAQTFWPTGVRLIRAKTTTDRHCSACSSRIAMGGRVYLLKGKSTQRFCCACYPYPEAEAA
jgi:hypothetical protein